MIQLTVDRFKGIAPIDNFWVVINSKYLDIVKEQIPGIPESHILAEPEARNTAPCIAWACWKIMAEDENANIVVTPSDAVVMNPEKFRHGLSLFMIMDTVDEFDFARDMARLAVLPRQAEWEAYVAQFQGAKVEARSDEKWQMMERIF